MADLDPIPKDPSSPAKPRPKWATRKELFEVLDLCTTLCYARSDGDNASVAKCLARIAMMKVQLGA